MSGNVSPTNVVKPVVQETPAEKTCPKAPSVNFDLSTLHSCENKSVLTTFWNGIKTGIGYLNWIVHRIVDFLCLKFLYSSEPEFDFVIFCEQCDRVLDYTLSSQEREEVFKKLPKEVQLKTFELFNQLSAKKIHSCEQLLTHPHFIKGFDLLTDKFLYCYSLKSQEMAYRKIGSSQENLTLFNDLVPQLHADIFCNYLKCLVPENYEQGDSASIDEASFQRIKTEFSKLLTKENFQPIVQSHIDYTKGRIASYDRKLARLATSR